MSRMPADRSDRAAILLRRSLTPRAVAVPLAVICACVVLVSRPLAQAPTPQPPTSCGTLYNRLLALTRMEVPAWSFHSDNGLPNGADPTLSTTGWPLVRLGEVWPGGAGWFRANVTVPASLSGYDVRGGKLRARFRTDSVGGYNLWVDGVPIGGLEQQANVVIDANTRPGVRVMAVHVNGSGDRPKLNEARLDFDPAPGRPNPRDIGEACRASEILLDTEAAGASRNAHRATLDRVVAAVDWAALERSDQQAFDASLRSAQAALQTLTPWLRTLSVRAVSHSHIDMAWLWTWTETVEVVRNTFRDVLQYMREYPQMVYVQSSAQSYAWMEEKYPEIFNEVLQRVKEGRWEVVGGMWVEPDLNMPDGESLVRQLLQGTRYFKQRLGVDIGIGWNPDSFGYSWQLPQIYRKSGISRFLTQKMAWNDTTKFPYQLFWWQAPDGSRVLTYFPHDYTNHMEAIKIAGDLADFQKASGRSELLHLYGIGDHGGGPMRAMLENAVRWQAPGAVFPRLSFSRADSFFDAVEKKGTADLPVWNDEMYLEYHRGVYTSQASTKQHNREAEEQLTNAEKLLALVPVPPSSYPADDLSGAWRSVLFSQFHDVLAGSSIAAVYRDADRDYARVRLVAGDIIRQGLERLAARVRTEGEGRPVVVFNPLSWDRSEVVEVPLPPGVSSSPLSVVDATGHAVLADVVSRNQRPATVRFLAHEVPSLGYAVFRLVARAAKAASTGGALATESSLENERLRVTIDRATGCVTSVKDKQSGRETIAAGGCGNLLQLFVDKPKDWDAWNIDADFEKQGTDLKRADSVTVVERGPVRAALEITRRVNGSTIVQEVRLDAGSPRLDLVTDIDWHERHTLLKAAFPLAVQADFATYEIPYGAIKRPTTRRTPAERAKFEVPALRWADMSGEGFGTSLLNDSKYGYDGKDNVLRLSLLRSPTWPDPEADQGHHRFVYSLYPHARDWREAGTVRRGYELNYPLLAVSATAHAGDWPAAQALVSVQPANVVVTAIKKAEDGDDVVLRIYESAGETANVRVQVSGQFVSARDADLMERPGSGLALGSGEVAFTMRPFEIKTIRIARQR